MLKAAEVVIAENAHGFYCVPRAAAQRPAALKIINGEVWEPETIDFVVRHCVDRSVVHAGAFFGDFLPAVSRALVDVVHAHSPSVDVARGEREVGQRRKALVGCTEHVHRRPAISGVGAPRSPA